MSTAQHTQHTTVTINSTFHVDGPAYATHDRDHSFHILCQQPGVRHARSWLSIPHSMSTAPHMRRTTVVIHSTFYVNGPTYATRDRDQSFHIPCQGPGIRHARPHHLFNIIRRHPVYTTKNHKHLFNIPCQWPGIRQECP